MTEPLAPPPRHAAGAPRDPQRARFLRATLGIAASATVLATSAAVAPGARTAGTPPGVDGRPVLQKRRIPSTGEPLPVIGCGTWVGFDVPDRKPEMAELAAVVAALFDAGGSVLDSSPMYGRSEAVAGQLLAAQDRKAFVATKVWTSGRGAGIEQVRESTRLLGRVDLLQVHNLLDWKTHLPVLQQSKAEGRVRYVGVTHYTASAYRELEAVMRAERLDFVQINYAIDDREAEKRILPLAAERGIAVLVNRPFGGGGLLRRLANGPLPPWAAEIGATSWSQVLLKFVLAHPAVTCAIPGTGKARHMAENAGAATGLADLPDRAFWNRHAADVAG